MIVDTTLQFFIMTKAGLYVELDAGSLPPNVARHVGDGDFEEALRALVKVTGQKCSMTINSKSTLKPEHA